jgi:hypothetical protein
MLRLGLVTAFRRKELLHARGTTLLVLAVNYNYAMMFDAERFAALVQDAAREATPRAFERVIVVDRGLVFRVVLS